MTPSGKDTFATRTSRYQTATLAPIWPSPWRSVGCPSWWRLLSTNKYEQPNMSEAKKKKGKSGELFDIFSGSQWVHGMLFSPSSSSMLDMFCRFLEKLGDFSESFQTSTTSLSPKPKRSQSVVKSAGLFLTTCFLFFSLWPNISCFKLNTLFCRRSSWTTWRSAADIL